MRRPSIFSWTTVTAGSLAFLYFGCTQDFEQFEPGDNSTSSAGGAGGTSADGGSSTGNEGVGGEIFVSSGSASGSGTGAGAPCSNDTNCNDANTCTTDTCVNNNCSVVPLPDGPIPGVADNPTNCTDAVCLDGVSDLAVDDTEIPDDGKDCTVDTCVMGVPKHVNAADGTPCAAGVCNAQGQCVGCIVADDCGESTFCLTWACDGGVCFPSEKANNTILPANEQVTGDCQQLKCNGSGGAKSLTENTDVPFDDGNPCTSETCTQGTPVHPLKPEGAVCSGDGLCTATGQCVDCLDNGDCTGAAQCLGNVCVCSTTCMTLGLTCGTTTACGQPLICDDGIKNGTETDIDCGGGAGCSVKCTAGHACTGASNCVANFCVDGVCCNNACTQTCSSCIVTGNLGTCAFLPLKQDDTAPMCSGAMTCDGAGGCKKDTGQGCMANSECATGACSLNICS